MTSTWKTSVSSRWHIYYTILNFKPSANFWEVFNTLEISFGKYNRQFLLVDICKLKFWLLRTDATVVWPPPISITVAPNSRSPSFKTVLIIASGEMMMFSTVLARSTVLRKLCKIVRGPSKEGHAFRVGSHHSTWIVDSFGNHQLREFLRNEGDYFTIRCHIFVSADLTTFSTSASVIFESLVTGIIPWVAFWFCSKFAGNPTLTRLDWNPCFFFSLLIAVLIAFSVFWYSYYNHLDASTFCIADSNYISFLSIDMFLPPNTFVLN